MRRPMYLLPLAAVLQDAGGVIDGPEVFADGQVGSLVLVDMNHQVVELQLGLLSCLFSKMVKSVFRYNTFQHVVGAQFLASFSYRIAFLCEKSGAYLLADDLGANVILDCNAKPHLLQDELRLLLFRHRAICLHLRQNK